MTFRNTLISLISTLFVLAGVLALAQDKHHEHKQHESHHHNEAAQKNGEIVIHDPIIAITPPGIINTAGYFHIMNHSDTDVELVGATSSIAERTEIHEHSMKDGMMKMQKINSLVIPAKSTINFEPGGYHIMFMNVKSPINEGQTLDYQLIFSNNQTITVKAKVKEPKQLQHKKHQHHHGSY